jgi:hypothetical protein
LRPGERLDALRSPRKDAPRSGSDDHHLAKVGVAGSNPVVRSRIKAADLEFSFIPFVSGANLSGTRPMFSL